MSAGVHTVPESVQALGALPGTHYADHFSIPAGAVATPERWARALFGDVPDLGERFIWRGLLGLRLSHGRSPETVGGWRIEARGDDWIRLAAASWFLSARMVVRAAAGQVSLTTFLRYDRGVGRLYWPPLSAVHRALVPGALRHAAERIRPGGNPDERD